MQLKTSIKNTIFTKLDKKIKDIQRNIKNVQKEIGEEEVLYAKKRVTNTKLDPDGIPWAPWRISTIRQRTRERNLQRGLLYRTGRLLNSFKYKIEGNKTIIYSTAPYSGFLQKGRLNMRPRQILGFGSDSIKRIKQRLKGVLTK